MSEAVDLFLELAAIPSPPGEERGVADVVLRYLGGLGLEPDEDDCGPRIGSSAGNIYARVEPTAEGTPLFLCAHMDTVPPDGKLEPVVEDGVVRNAGGTILGGDNKAAVTAMLEGVRRVLAENMPHAGIELVFTPKEEVGLVGAYAFDHDRLRAQVGYVYDQEGAMGEVVLGAPWSRALEVSFHGRSAHAGMAPEEGRSAIQAAAKAIADLRLGRVDELTTATSARSRAARPATSFPSGARSPPRRAATTRRSSARSCRRCSTPSPSPRPRPTATSRRRCARATTATG